MFNYVFDPLFFVVTFFWFGYSNMNKMIHKYIIQSKLILSNMVGHPGGAWWRHHPARVAWLTLFPRLLGRWLGHTSLLSSLAFTTVLFPERVGARHQPASGCNVVQQIDQDRAPSMLGLKAAAWWSSHLVDEETPRENVSLP